ncbi:PAM68 family protein [Anthocerotibacter panamensis]|uniref:PAM68 family protein n=1 Tax=Anthocerotibacter panamensis TaxID=2857077 RepID=UPI001C405C5F|nr:PAM68 family protein [Anthocerotibacter panamensis]
MAKKNRSRRAGRVTPPVQSDVPFTKDGIPKPVADRMGKRAAAFGAPPTLLMFATFFVSYWLLSRGVPIPPGMVLFVSISFAALASGGVVYGMLSTPWGVGEQGTPLGWRAFRTNLQRLFSGLETESERLRTEKRAAKVERGSK